MAAPLGRKSRRRNRVGRRALAATSIERISYLPSLWSGFNAGRWSIHAIGVDALEFALLASVAWTEPVALRSGQWFSRIDYGIHQSSRKLCKDKTVPS